MGIMRLNSFMPLGFPVDPFKPFPGNEDMADFVSRVHACTDS